MSFLAIDIGGTKLAAALVDAGGVIGRRGQVRTLPNAAGEGDALWATLCRLLDDVCGDQSPVAVGVGCGGPMRWPTGLVSPLNLAAWRDFPLRERLAERFPDRPVRVANDAMAMAIGEHWQGVGAASRAFLGVVVSTGVGGGLVMGGRVVMGDGGNAGHVGHIVVAPAGPPCGCGGQGCLEAVARGPAIVQWAVARGWRALGGTAPDGPQLLSAARDGDRIARAAFERAGSALGQAVASAASLLELDTVAVGGGLAAAAGDLLLDPARSALDRYGRLGFVRNCRIVPARLGADAGLVGAAALVSCGDRYWPAGAD